MTALKGSPRFTGFNRRLVEEGFISAENMQNAILNAKKANQDIVPFLIDQLKISSLDIAEKSLKSLVNRFLISAPMILHRLSVKVLTKN